MSRKKTDEQYNKSFASRFFRWLNGEEDPYIGVVEMKPQKEPEGILEAKSRHKEEVFYKIQHIYDIKHNRQYRKFNALFNFSSIVFCIILVAVLTMAISYMPPVGSADRPVNNEVSLRYIESGLQETGAVNIVGGMILDYRAFDTLGESHVLFVATITVLILLRRDTQRKDGKVSDYYYEPKDDIVLQMVTKFLMPAIVIFGIYVILNGHLGPGGGFSGGAVIGAGLILYQNAFGFRKTGRFFTAGTYKWVSFGALSFYCLAKSYSFFTGANHLESVIPKGTPGDILSSGLILPLNIAVGLVVACTMYAFYAMFRKGGF
ncbi:MAG: hypothetical protein K5641_04315 [Lachnospiraceae bacterium]|nr:hypothetical protein [Lachnospiraceae bacterium]